jgi:hypothetical protein
MMPGFQSSQMTAFSQTTTVGRCSICGGHVVVPNLWAGSVPPVPTCEICGAIEAPYDPAAKPLPILRMTLRADNPSPHG